MTLFIVRFAAVVAIAFAATGCATIIRGTEEQVSITSDPVGATVTLSNGQSCVTPCLITAKRDTALQVTIEKPGCNVHSSAMIPTLSGGGVILGGLIDYGTGAVYDLQPNPLHVKMTCNAPPPR